MDHSTQMNNSFPDSSQRKAKKLQRTLLALAAISILSLSAPAYGQQRFSREYPARKNVRFQLTNRFGTIEVKAWNRDRIRVEASMDSPAARFTPELTSDSLVIDVVRDNRSRTDVGDVNFTVYVPSDSTVDIETKRGNITVRDVQGAMVRARVSLGGDIELTGIRASQVMAENTMGNILFDGELASNGSYEFKTMQGDVSISIPADSAFRLIATAPFTRSITLGSFSNAGLNSIGDGRKVVGSVGDGRAQLTITNYRGRISFIRR